MGTLYQSTRAFRLWTATVEEQYRLRLSSGLAEVVPWLKAQDGFQIDCAGVLGPEGQFQVMLTLPGADVVKQIETSLLATEAQINESSTTDWSRLVRFAAMSWTVHIAFEQGKQKYKYKRFTVTLPKEARQFSIVPSEVGDLVAVFAVAPVIEIWKPSEWLQHAASTRTNITSLTSRALEELDERNE